ncbi:hypothetical protein MNBD_GAMMA12-1784 [hydrothermal vent metagenome]|uniref:Uncharacterized protein n=1 Tax=hydrothermal vent metagenome TaxID=652676 RepID=A0A3B0YSL4_9ZZZZ
MSNEITFRVKINRLTNTRLFDQVSAYPSGTRAELTRLALSGYLDKHTAIPSLDDDSSFDELTSMME